jgi:hypothetical protein
MFFMAGRADIAKIAPAKDGGRNQAKMASKEVD